MRKLMWFTLGFGAVCALCSYLWLTEGLLLPGIILAGVSCLLLVGSRWVKWFRIPATIALGCALALGWFQLYATQYLRPAAALDGQITEVTARCTDYSYRTNYGTAVEGFLHLDGMPYRAKFYVSGEIDMEPGDALYMGDARSDMVAARAAGMDFAYASWGSFFPMDRSEPDFYPDCPMDLVQMLKQDA